MSSLQAIQFLTAAARYAREGESFSKDEIVKKLQDIKYLSSQKKVPRLTLRKEVILLEDQLQGALQLEQKLSREKNKDSIAVTSLKQQLTILKTKLKAVEDLELDKKLDHLSFLLGEHLAKQEVAGEIELAQAVESTQTQKSSPHIMMDAGAKVAMLQRRLDALKQELELYRELKTKKPAELQQIEKSINLIETKLEQYQEHHPRTKTANEEEKERVIPGEVKHTLLFPKAESKEEDTEVQEKDMELQKQLPLPPPPRMRKKKE